MTYPYELDSTHHGSKRRASGHRQSIIQPPSLVAPCRTFHPLAQETVGTLTFPVEGSGVPFWHRASELSKHSEMRWLQAGAARTMGYASAGLIVAGMKNRHTPGHEPLAPQELTLQCPHFVLRNPSTPAVSSALRAPLAPQRIPRLPIRQFWLACTTPQTCRWFPCPSPVPVRREHSQLFGCLLVLNVQADGGRKTCRVGPDWDMRCGAVWVCAYGQESAFLKNIGSYPRGQSFPVLVER